MWHWVSTNWVPLPFWDEWHTPGSQFESLYRGTLTLKEMFSQHNESRNFFPRLLYFALEHFGGWDVRKEIRVVFFGVCALCLLLLDLLRRTPAQLPFPFWSAGLLMTFLCFAPVQVENFLYGIEIETFFPGFALLVAAAINLSAVSFSPEGAGKSRSRFRRDLHFCQRHARSGRWPGRCPRLTNRRRGGRRLSGPRSTR